MCLLHCICTVNNKKKEDKQKLWVCSFFLSDSYCLSLNPEHGCRGVLEQYLCKTRQIFGQNCKWIIYVCNTRRTVSITKWNMLMKYNMAKTVWWQEFNYHDKQYVYALFLLSMSAHTCYHRNILGHQVKSQF